ncbi:winged helix-turn-helix domain-containing protein [Streptomyces sp. NPDC014684]|uniref:helix-turn-helix domain-containing protein n=1 Tax=Streptomyces sp. NPDC014684 TaxID=3364880 RepID=UPI0036F71065
MTLGRRFQKSYTVQGVAALLKRHGSSCQIPARRAPERNEAAVVGWVWGLTERGRTGAAALDAPLAFEDEAGYEAADLPHVVPPRSCPGRTTAT